LNIISLIIAHSWRTLFFRGPSVFVIIIILLLLFTAQLIL